MRCRSTCKIGMSIRKTFYLASVGLCSSMAITGQSVDISGIIRNASRDPLHGIVAIFEEGPDLVVTSYAVDDEGEFRVFARTQHGALVRVSAEGHPPDERYLPPGTSGRMQVEFNLPDAQDLSGRVIDLNGRGVGNVAVHVRYHEPDRPPRRAAFHDFHRTDGDGYFKLSDVGINIPFFVDVHVSGYRPVSSERMVREEGHTDVGEIVLEEEGATVVVRLHDRDGAPIRGAQVILLADPAGYRSYERGSLLHSRAFNQRAITSAFGNARFSGVPVGRIRVHAISQVG